LEYDHLLSLDRFASEADVSWEAHDAGEATVGVVDANVAFRAQLINLKQVVVRCILRIRLIYKEHPHLFKLEQLREHLAYSLINLNMLSLSQDLPECFQNLVGSILVVVDLLLDVYAFDVVAHYLAD